MITALQLRSQTRIFWTAPLLMLALGCSKPERPAPAGPGVTADKAAIGVEQVPKLSDAQKASALSAEQRKVVVAKIGDREVTLGDLEQRLLAEPAVVQSQFASVQKRKEYLAKLVQFEVMVLEGQRRGLDKDPEVVEAMRQAMVRKYLQTALPEEVDPRSIPEADLKTYYDANPGVFHKPEQVELSHMLLSDKAKADQVRKEIESGAEGNTAKLVSLWNDYVVRVSEDKASAPYLGALGLVSRTLPPGATPADQERFAALPKAMVDAAMALEPFTLGPVVQSDKGFHVILVTSKSPAVDKSFDAAKDSIRSRIAKRERDLRRQQLLEDLRAKAKVQIDDDAVRLIPQPKFERAPKLEGPGVHDHSEHGPGEGEPAAPAGAPAVAPPAAPAQPTQPAQPALPTQPAQPAQPAPGK
jgi:peptidyl-prolyl cis-trans isomerase C